MDTRSDWFTHRINSFRMLVCQMNRYKLFVSGDGWFGSLGFCVLILFFFFAQNKNQTRKTNRKTEILQFFFLFVCSLLLCSVWFYCCLFPHCSLVFTMLFAFHKRQFHRFDVDYNFSDRKKNEMKWNVIQKPLPANDRSAGAHWYRQQKKAFDLNLFNVLCLIPLKFNPMLV